MDTLLIKTFLSLAETKSFTLTSKKMHRSQSAISLQISRLEETVGTSLFARNKRSVALTKEGELFFEYAKRYTQVENELLTLFRKPTVRGAVRFGIPEDVATVYLPEILSNFSTSHPHITLDVHCDLTINLLKGFEADEYDLVLIKQDPKLPYLNNQPVWNESLVWVKSQKCKEDTRLSLAVAPPPCVYRQRAIETLNAYHIPWRIIYTSPSVAGIIAAVKAGLGIAVLPINMVSKGLQIIKNLPNIPDAQIALIQNQSGPEFIQTFSQYIKEHIPIHDHKILVQSF